MLHSKYSGMNTIRATLSSRTVRGQSTRLKEGMAVKSRPERSPAFQNRKGSGMKLAGWRIRGAVEAGVTLRICCVKTGKNIVSKKVRKTALDR